MAKERASGEMKYIMKIPREIPDRWGMVHNHVRPQRVIGMNGFRVWLQPIDKTLVVCPCKWTEQLHYRIRGLGKLKRARSRRDKHEARI
jgi:hypothetical protein